MHDNTKKSTLFNASPWLQWQVPSHIQSPVPRQGSEEGLCIHVLTPS